MEDDDIVYALKIQKIQKWQRSSHFTIKYIEWAESHLKRLLSLFCLTNIKKNLKFTLLHRSDLQIEVNYLNKFIINNQI